MRQPGQFPAPLLSLHLALERELRDIAHLEAIHQKTNNPILARVIAAKKTNIPVITNLLAPGLFAMPSLPTLMQLQGVHIGEVPCNGSIIPIQMSRGDLTTSTMIAGQPGSGKSFAAALIDSGLFQQDKMSTWIFAVEGNELNNLLSHGAKNFLILDCNPGGNFRMNLLAKTEHASLPENLEDIIRPLTQWYVGVRTIGDVKPVLSSLLQDSAPRGINDFYSAIKALKHSEGRTLMLNRLELFRDTPLFDTTSPLDIGLLAKTDVVFLLDRYDHDNQSLFIYRLCMLLLRHKRVLREHLKPVEQQHLNTIHIEEAQRFLPSVNSQREDLATHPLTQVVNQGRKFGVSGLFVLQRPSVIEQSFLQAGILLAGSLATEPDIRALRTTMGLSPEQASFLSTCPKAVFLFKKTNLGMFPIQIPRRDMMWGEIDVPQHNANFLAAFPDRVQLLHRERNMQKPQLQTDDAKALAFINQHYFHSASWYYKAMATEGLFGSSKAAGLIKNLGENNFLTIHEVPTGLKTIKAIEITPFAFERFGLKPGFKYFRGADFIHNLIGEWVEGAWNRKGWTVRRERMVGTTGHFADLLAERDGTTTAIEIAVGNAPPQEAANIRADLASTDRVEVVGNDRAHLEKVSQELAHDLKAKVTFRLFHEFLPTQAPKKAQGA